jgi:SAM-dependent methyltransferase
MKDNHKLYEKFSKLYEFFFKPFFIRGVLESIKTLEKQKPKSVLEVGCGPGYSFEYYPITLSVTAYDVSKSMVEEAKLKIKDLSLKNMKVLDVSDYQEYLKTKEFDSVVSLSVLSVVPEPQVFLNDLKNYCAQGGYLYLTVHNRRQGLKKYFDIVFDYPCRLLFGFTLLRHVEDFDWKGFEIVEIKSANKMLFFSLNDLVVIRKNS